MKAIITTAQNKSDNPKQLGSQAINSIKVFNQIPKVWRYDDKEQLYFDKRPQFQEDAGFRDVVKPTIDAETEKLGAIEFDGGLDVFTYPIIQKTQQEIDEYLAQQETDEINNEVSSDNADGQNLFEEIKKELVRRKKNGQLTQNQLLQIADFLYDKINCLNDGFIRLAQFRIDNTTPPPNQPFLAVYNYVKNTIDDFIANS